jgi:hypothetical protein
VQRTAAEDAPATASAGITSLKPRVCVSQAVIHGNILLRA